MSLAVAALLFCCAAQPMASANLQTRDSGSSELTEAATLSKSAVQLFLEGKYQEALPLARRALEIREKALSPTDDQLISSQRNLAEIYVALGKYGDARELFERVMKSLEQSAADQPSLAEILERLAVVQFALGYSVKTEELYKRALAINEIALGGEHPRVAGSISLLAEFYQFTGELKKAEPLYKRLLAIREKSSSPTATGKLRETADQYGCLLRKLQRDDEAKELRARVYGPEATGPQPGMASGGVLNGKAISLPRPPYPEEARAARISGTVVVQVTIDEGGNVIRVCAFHGPPLLATASERAARGAKFAPTLLDGKPVKVTGVITYNFVRR